MSAPSLPPGGKLEWKVIKVEDAKGMKALEDLLNDEWIITNVYSPIYVLARVFKSAISPIL